MAVSCWKSPESCSCSVQPAAGVPEDCSGAAGLQSALQSWSEVLTAAQERLSNADKNMYERVRIHRKKQVSFFYGLPP